MSSNAVLLRAVLVMILMVITLSILINYAHFYNNTLDLYVYMNGYDSDEIRYRGCSFSSLLALCCLGNVPSHCLHVICAWGWVDGTKNVLLGRTLRTNCR